MILKHLGDFDCVPMNKDSGTQIVYTGEVDFSRRLGKFILRDGALVVRDRSTAELFFDISDAGIWNVALPTYLSEELIWRNSSGVIYAEVWVAPEEGLKVWNEHVQG